LEDEMANQQHEIVVHGRNIRCEIRDVDIYELQYYRENPRINYIISKYSEEDVTDELIEKTLLQLDTTRELRQDIEQNGGLLEPIVVLDNQVIEGNTRLCCYRRIYSKTDQDSRWRHIKAHVILDNVDEVEIFALLSNYHIRGKKKWEPYEKAACACRMIEQGQDIVDVAKEIGSTRPKLENIIAAYKAMRNKYLPMVEGQSQTGGDGREELSRYSYFEAFYTNKDLADRVAETPGFLDQFTEWVADGRIPKAQDVRELHNILGNAKSKREFLSDDVDDAHYRAMEVLYWDAPHKVDAFYMKINKFRELLDQCKVDRIKEEIEENGNRKSQIKRCFRVFQKFCKEIGLS
jgi:hypothetical protein